MIWDKIIRPQCYLDLLCEYHITEDDDDKDEHNINEDYLSMDTDNKHLSGKTKK